jgi:acetyl esterase/lipase
VDRRTVLGLGAGLLANLPRAARAAESAAPETIVLWPDGVPGGARPALQLQYSGPADERNATGIIEPALALVRPPNPDGCALLIVPGGGYMQEGIDIEGFDIAHRFAEAGVTSFVLTYRLPYEGWSQGPIVVLQDAQRALRTIRARAHTLDLDPVRIGAIGFSAGGHVVATLAARSDDVVYPVMDAIDALDARPSFFALGYPVITMLPPFAHEASREKLLGTAATTAERQDWSVERFVNAGMPPGFLFAAADDIYVPPENTLMMAAALREKHVAAEMHLFETGGHGFGIRVPSTSTTFTWPDLFLRWGRAHAVFKG